MFDKLLYLPLDIENPPLTSLDRLNDKKYDSLIRDTYRNCFHVPMMMMTDIGFIWTETSKEFPELVEWAEDCIFPWSGKSRIMIITTPAGESNPPHIDCSPQMSRTLQHKFRYVLQGNVDDLIFMTDQGDVRLENVDKPFIMSGKWPHYMKNTADVTKFTFAFGAPWDGNLNDYRYTSLLDRSYEKYENFYNSTNGYDLPKEYEDYYEEKYK
jgi:hypothetical protein